MRIIVPFAPGGSVIGTDAVAKSAPDGCTLLLMSNTHTVNESLIPHKPFQLMCDFVPIAPINYSDLVRVARADLLHGRVLHVLRDGALAGLVTDAAFAHLAASVQWHSAPMPAEEATDLQRLPATTRLVAFAGVMKPFSMPRCRRPRCVPATASRGSRTHRSAPRALACWTGCRPQVGSHSQGLCAAASRARLAPQAASSSEAVPHESASSLHPPSGTNAALVGTPEETIKALGNASIKVLTMKPGDVLEF